MKRSLFAKIFGGYVALIGLLLAGIFFFAFGAIRQHYIATLSKDLSKMATILMLQVKPLLANGRHDELDALIKSLDKQLALRITVIDRQGVVIADSEEDPASMENHKTRPEVIEAIHGLAGSSQRYSTTVHRDMLYVALPIREGERVTGVLRMSLFLSDINLVLGSLRRSIALIGLLATGIALLVSFVFARRLATPVRKLGEASRRVAAGDFNVRVFLKGNDELYECADSFNYMTEKIRGLFDDISLQKEELDNIISSMREGLLVIGRSDQVLLANRGLQEMIRAGDVIGRFYWEVIRDPHFGEFVARVRDTRERVMQEISYHDRTFLCGAAFIEPKEEIVVTLLDITEIRDVERMKRDFVVNVSHELRTPLTAIKGFVETMQDEVTEGSLQRYLDIIKRHTDRLINIVKDLLTLSQLENGNGLEREAVNLQELIEQVAKVYEARLKEKNLTLTVDAPAEPVRVWGDTFRLEQVFFNLIDNAIKYTERGGITISLRRMGQGAVASVADTGIGMTREHLTRIFERFYVVDKSRSRSMGGTGLGLAIVKHIVLMHNGSIDVQSSFGVGTKFTVTIPLSAPQHSDQKLTEN